MGLLLRIDSPEFIDAANDIIHDCWFNTGDVSFGSTASRLVVPFERGSARRADRLQQGQAPGGGSCNQCLLCFDYVRAYLLEDAQKIGRYDFNRLQFDPAKKLITVLTNIPMRFEIHVAAFEVTIEIPSR